MDEFARRKHDLMVGESIADGRFTVLDKSDDELPGVSQVARPIGEGGTASVYRCRQRLGNSSAIRVVKFLNPTEEIIAKRALSDQTEGHSAFLTEIANLSQLNHQNLVRIIDAGAHNGAEFFVMDFVAGPTLAQICGREGAYDEWRSRASCDPFEPIRMVRQVCWALSYLHERGYYHMDVAPKNIFVAMVDGKPHVVLGDLGVAKQLRGAGIDLADLVVAAGTRRYCPPAAEHLRNKVVTVDELLKHAELWDCFSIGAVLEDVLDLPPNKSSLRTIALLAKHIRRHPERYTASLIAAELTRLLPDQLTTLGVEELSANSVGAITSISIPLYAVPISSRVGRLIDHPTFSRLRLIPQLLLVRTVYPGAQHTRFEHALGAYELARQVLLQLIAEPDFLLEFRAAELETTLVTALLIHLTAFQLHHVFEEALPEADQLLTADNGQRVSVLDWFLDHRPEKHAARNIEFETSGFSERLPSLREQIEEIFPRVNLNEILSLIRNRSGIHLPLNAKPSLRIISAIVRSSLDVRVMDYMLRDAHHAGIESGTNVDIAQIIGCMRVLSDPYKLVITRKGVHAVENLLCARYWMYSRVYWNDINRSTFAMLRYAVVRLVDSQALTLDTFVRKTMSSDERGAIMYLLSICPESDAFAPVIEILNSLLLPRPRSFRTLLEVTQHDEGTPAKLIDSYRERGPRDMESLYEHCAEVLASDVGLIVKPGDLLIDVPREALDKLGTDVDVLFGDRPKTLVSASKIVESLPEAFKTSAVKLRVFWSHRLRKAAARSSVDTETVRRCVKTALYAWI